MPIAKRAMAHAGAICRKKTGAACARKYAIKVRGGMGAVSGAAPVADLGHQAGGRGWGMVFLAVAQVVALAGMAGVEIAPPGKRQSGKMPPLCRFSPLKLRLNLAVAPCGVTAF